LEKKRNKEWEIRKVVREEEEGGDFVLGAILG